MIGNYCKPCGEFLLPEQTECPFCEQMAVPVDEVPDDLGDISLAIKVAESIAEDGSVTVRRNYFLSLLRAVAGRSSRLDPDPSRGVILAYGHAAYSAGWRAAILFFSNPKAVAEGHSREWIENNPPESFDMPLVWRDGTHAITIAQGPSHEQ